MKRKNLVAVTAIIIVSINSVLFGQQKPVNPSMFSAGVFTGYNRGFGIQPHITFNGFENEFPFEFRFGFGYTFLNPGNAADARRIFINNATNGTPEKTGRSFDLRFDFLKPQQIFGVDHSYIAFGPRYSAFKGNFKYIGGNEEFDVRSKQWGVGADIENHFKMTENLDLVLLFGLDFYFPGTLSGHDTSYSPDNDNVNPANDNENDDIPFRYKDANRAINQPGIMPRIMIGVNFDLQP